MKHTLRRSTILGVAAVFIYLLAAQLPTAATAPAATAIAATATAATPPVFIQSWGNEEGVLRAVIGLAAGNGR